MVLPHERHVSVLGIHDLAQQGSGSRAVLTAQFEHRLHTMDFPPSWEHVLARIDSSWEDAEVSPPTERER